MADPTPDKLRTIAKDLKAIPEKDLGCSEHVETVKKCADDLKSVADDIDQAKKSMGP